MKRPLVTLIVLASMGAARAQIPTTPSVEAVSAETTIAVESVAPIPKCHELCAGTIIELEITEALGSARNQRGHRFSLRLAEPLLIDGQVRVPAGSLGEGEIVHAMPGKGGGKPGELLIAGRYLDMAGARMPLRGLKLGSSGKDNAVLALVSSFALGPFAIFIRGGEMEIPAGTRVHAKLGQDFNLALPLPPADSTTSPPAVSTSQE